VIAQEAGSLVDGENRSFDVRLIAAHGGGGALALSARRIRAVIFVGGLVRCHLYLVARRLVGTAWRDTPKRFATSTTDTPSRITASTA
jgi:hypothetical protein